MLESARRELIHGLQGMLGGTLRIEQAPPHHRAILLGTLSELLTMTPESAAPKPLALDSYWLRSTRVNGLDCLLITGNTDRSILYGVFALLTKIARNADVGGLNEISEPHAPIRWVNQWDNLDASIERGYAGNSIFFENGRVRADLSRVSEYARILASVGINGCVINNVNADPHVLRNDFLPELARIADAFRPWGVRLGISVDFASPKLAGGLATFDPLEPQVSEFWQYTVDQIYGLIPDFGGLVLKADSEGRLGPSVYGRSHADAANVIARALKPHGGVLFYRAFVYNHHLDWREPKSDRAKAAYENFHPLDGQFDDNVIVQIKHGPIDFQVREPVSPLFSGLEKTNEAIELQISQEYTGQQRHLCFLAPMWKEVLDFDLNIGDKPSKVIDIVAGKVFRRSLGGLVGVANVGLDANWLGHPLAMSNLYAFGRLAWDPGLTSSQIADQWTRLTFGNDPVVVKTISGMLLASWNAYENYTGPLGLQTLTDILGTHYGPGIESSERNGWGQWHRADHHGIGMDRTQTTGTGFVAQYPKAVASTYESLDTTPDNLVLFFHHLPYTYKLHSGNAVIQQIYDLHYQGARKVAAFVRQWESLKGKIDPDRHAGVLAKLTYQAGHAIVWRDAVCNWFFRTSGIPDTKDRVGRYPDRIEAEAMELGGYLRVDVEPWENASGGKAVECRNPAGCSASLRFDRRPGSYDIAVQYFDQNNGEAIFRFIVNERLVHQWVANDHLPSDKVGGDTSTRRTITAVALRPGDVIRIDGVPNSQERAALDYIEIVASSEE